MVYRFIGSLFLRCVPWNDGVWQPSWRKLCILGLFLLQHRFVEHVVLLVSSSSVLVPLTLTMHFIFRFCCTAIYSYFGQAFVACIPTVPTAQILASVFIGLNNFFSGLIVHPQYLSGFFEVPYWITPGHYVFEGMVMALFSKNDNVVIVMPGSTFYESISCTAGEECTGTVSDFVDVFFGGRFQKDHIWYDALICGMFLLMACVATYYGLRFFNYMNT